MALINQLTLPSMVIIPWLGAAFLLFIPDYENDLRKKFALFMTLLTTALLGRNIFVLYKTKSLSLDLTAIRPSFINGSFFLRFDFITSIGIAFILAICLILFLSRLSDTYRESGLYSKILVALGLANACFLVSHQGFFFLLQLALIQLFLLFHLLGFGPLRGSSSLQAGVFFAVVDLSAFLAWSFQGDLLGQFDPLYTAFIISLPAITRLCVPFFSPWANSFFANSSLDLNIAFLSFSSMLAATSLARSGTASELLSSVTIVAAFFGAVLCFSEGPLAQFLIRVASVMMSLVFFTLTQSNTMRLQALLCLASFLLLFTVAMLVQRALSVSEEGIARSHLLLIWLLSLILMLVSAAELLPINQTAWLAIIVITASACATRVLSPLTSQVGVLHFFSSRFSGLMLFNTWLCFSLVFAFLVGVHIFLQRGGVLL
jgi:hypothetical protein